jgi:hypothetical protein
MAGFATHDRQTLNHDRQTLNNDKILFAAIPSIENFVEDISPPQHIPNHSPKLTVIGESYFKLIRHSLLDQVRHAQRRRRAK